MLSYSGGVPWIPAYAGMRALSLGVDIAAQRFLIVAALGFGFFVGLLGGAAVGGRRCVVGARFGAVGFVVLFDALLEHGAILLGAAVLLGATALGRLLATLFGTLCGSFPQVLLRRVGPRRAGDVDGHGSTVGQSRYRWQITINYRLCRSPALTPKSIH